MPSRPPTPVPGRPSRALRALLLGAGAGLLGACTTQQVQPSPASEMAGMGPLLTVERFLQAANSRDYQAMANLFGTADGPFEGERTEVELQMDLIANILRHQDYGIASESQVAGRRHPTTRVGVDLTMQRRTVPDVGFLVVRSNEGRWLVEEIDLEKITGG